MERFEAIEELILDNNEIDDDAEFPQLKHLHTLTLNKNNVSFSLCLSMLVIAFNLHYLNPLNPEGCMHWHCSNIIYDISFIVMFMNLFFYTLHGFTFLNYHYSIVCQYFSFRLKISLG